MKVEPEKVQPKDSRNRTENTLQQSLRQPAISDQATPTASSFERILREAGKQTDGDERSRPEQKTSNSPKSSEATESEKDVETTRALRERDESEERSGDESRYDGQADGDADGYSTLASLGLSSGPRTSTENVTPAARAILHIADLERIVSAIRTERFKNEQQVTLALKHSVLEGLQIRLTINEGGKLKAEFLALNEQIKKQLNDRKRELSDIFRHRSVNLSEIVVADPSTFPMSELRSGQTT